ncbi:MAG TPA: phosphoesterase [Elusimicrobia bacterium]|nr:phosphoesterase [Elusimicrobiota bacterium]HBT62663.1 phosphoesterase [Elusimicrobiota bacterium]
MNSFDSGVLLWLNQFARHSDALDAAVYFLSDSRFLKGEVMMLVLWWFWNSPSKPVDKNREIIVSTILSAAAAILLGRFLAHFLPFRARPIFNPSLGFVPPFYAEKEIQMRDWSAFPSDHAMLFAALTTGMIFLARRFGAAAYAYWFVIIGLPRLYLGLHYPTDIIAGGALGTAMACLANRRQWRCRIARLPLAWSRAHPSSFYAFFFLISYQVATMFYEPRFLARAAGKLLGR